MRYRIHFSRQAFIDLEGIVEYYYNLSPKTASKYYHGIIKSTKKLASFPTIGRIVPECEEEYVDKYREVIYEYYRTIYRIEDKTCKILRIIDSRRLLTFDFIKGIR
jgi:plasmid stabilization system protein ParE